MARIVDPDLPGYTPDMIKAYDAGRVRERREESKVAVYAFMLGAAAMAIIVIISQLGSMGVIR